MAGYFGDINRVKSRVSPRLSRVKNTGYFGLKGVQVESIGASWDGASGCIP